MTADNGLSYAGYDGSNYILYDHELNLSETVSGSVETEEGTAVADAYVVLWGTIQENVDPSNWPDASTAEEAAEDLREAAKDPIPDEFDRQFSYQDSMEDFDGKYVAVHTRDQWAQNHWVPTRTDPELSQPVVVHQDPDQKLVFSTWDASKGSGVWGDDADEDLPGATVPDKTTIVIEQVGPMGDTIDTHNIETDEYGKSGVNPIFGKQHYAQEFFLSTGVYKVYPETSSNIKPVWIMVGNPAEQYARSLLDEASLLSDQADRIKTWEDDSKISKKVVQADSDGNWSADVPSNWTTVDVIGYHDNGVTDISDPSNFTVQKMVDGWESLDEDKKQSVYLPSEPKTVTPPQSNVTVVLKEVDNPSYSDLAEILSGWEWLQEFLDEETWNDLMGLTESEVGDLTDSEIKELKEQLEDLVDQNDDLRDMVEELKDEISGAITEEELIRIIQEAIASQDPEYIFEDPEIIVEPPPGWDDDDDLSEPALIDMVIPIADAVTDILENSPGEVSVIAHHSDGSIHTLSEDQYEIRSTTLSDAVVISDYELPSDVAAVSFHIQVAGDEGVGDTRERVVNPRFDLPSIDSVNLSTIEANTDKEVSLSINSTEGTLDAVRVYAPDGTQVTSSVSSGEATFTPTQSGGHLVEIDIEDGDGDIFTEKVRLPVNSQDVNRPSSARIAEGVVGNLVLAGDNIEDGSFDQSDAEARIALNLTDTDGSHVSVFAGDAITEAEKDITVRLMDSSGRNISKKKGVKIYTRQLDAGALVHRNDEPIHETTIHGEIIQMDGNSVIKTHTDATGSAKVTINNDPSWFERQAFKFSLIRENPTAVLEFVWGASSVSDGGDDDE